MDSDRPRPEPQEDSEQSGSRTKNKKAAIEGWLHGQWAKKGLFAWLLSPVSFIFLCVSKKRADSAEPKKLPVPVVVVGNIYVGGTGKTPVTIALVNELRRLGWAPGVISRGYGRKSDAPVDVNSGSNAHEAGDEPLLIAEKTSAPVVVGRDRHAAGELLLKNHPETDIIVSDDGLQHYALSRDIEICVVGARGLGNEWVLPAGPLREPPSRLDRVDAVVLNSTVDTLETRTPRFAATATFLGCRRLADGERVSLEELRRRTEGKSIVAAAGIAVPGRFFAMLRGRSIVCRDTMALGDHFSFETDPFASLDCDCVLITEKDAVKCERVPSIKSNPKIWVVEYGIDLDPYLVGFVDRKLKDRRGREAAN